MTFRLRRTHDLDLVAPPEAHDWRDAAACAVACEDPDHPAVAAWWDTLGKHPTVDQHHDALDVCARCPVLDDCLADADANLDRYAIRGGQLPAAWRRAQHEQSETA